VHTIRKNKLLVASKEVCLDINAMKIKYMLMSCEQNARQNHNIRIGNKSFESEAMFRWSGIKLPCMKKLRPD
jgi:hypothetical protein